LALHILVEGVMVMMAVVVGDVHMMELAVGDDGELVKVEGGSEPVA
jgi:hypothetical protein